MKEEEFERWTLVLAAVGSVLAVVEFLVVALVVGKGTIVGYQNGMLAGAFVVVAVVVLTWLATVILRPKESSPGDTGISSEDAPGG